MANAYSWRISKDWRIIVHHDTVLKHVEEIVIVKVVQLSSQLNWGISVLGVP